MCWKKVHDGWVKVDQLFWVWKRLKEGGNEKFDIQNEKRRINLDVDS